MRRRVVRRVCAGFQLVLGLASAGCSTLHVWNVRQDPCVHPLFTSEGGAKVVAYTTTDSVRNLFHGRAWLLVGERLQFDEVGYADRDGAGDLPTTFMLPCSRVLSVEYRVPDAQANRFATGLAVGGVVCLILSWRVGWFWWWYFWG